MKHTLVTGWLVIMAAGVMLAVDFTAALSRVI
jgi:hypothetical protein